MAVFNVVAEADNVCASWGSDGYTELYTTGDIYAGAYEVTGSWQVYELALRFTDVTIPGGSVITNAYFTIKTHDPVGTPDMDIQAFDEDNSAQVSSFADFQGRSRTTANINWTQVLSADTVYDSPEIKTVMQEIVDRVGWTSGNALQLVMSDHDTKYSNAPPVGTNQQGRFYRDSVYGITLTVTYISLPTVSTGASTLIDVTTATLNGEITNTGGENNDQRGFDYGLTISYGLSATDSGSYGTGAFSKLVESLNSNALYHFRAKSHNQAGWGYGSDTMFNTLPSIEEKKKMSRLVYDEMMEYMMEDY